MTEEFLYLQKLLRDNKAIIGFNKFFIRNTLLLCIENKSSFQFWILGIFSWLTSEWVCIPISIFFAWRFNSWWLVLLGIAFSWAIDEIMKTTAMYVVRKSILSDESTLDYLWSLQPFHITISSTRMVPKGESFYVTMAEVYSKKGDIETSERIKSEMTSIKSKETESKVFICPPNDWRKEIKVRANDFE
jgi:hypothetical protein